LPLNFPASILRQI